MDDPTSLLFGLDSFRVVDVVRVADRVARVVIETVTVQGLCRLFTVDRADSVGAPSMKEPAPA